MNTHEEAAALDRPPLLIRRPLEAFLDEHGLGGGELQAEPVGDGHSNVTYLIRRDGGEWVLRRPPRPPLPPSAHDVLREALLLRALEGTDVRVPKVLATCDDETLLGVPFYVMERVHGVVLADELPGRRWTRSASATSWSTRSSRSTPSTGRRCGLEGFGKPTGYLERQVRRFTGLWEHNATREIAAIDEVTRWLGENLPESGPATIVHGDYRLGNVMYSGERLSAIFDWELATIGDPLADIGYLLATYAQPGDPPSIVASLTTVTRREGFPTRDALVARYEERSGRAMTAVPWYTTLALWKSAIFLEGSYKRRLAGSTDDPFFDRLKDGVPAIAERARQTASG